MKNWKYLIVAILLCVVAAGGLTVLLKNNEQSGTPSTDSSSSSGNYDEDGELPSDSGGSGNIGGGDNTPGAGVNGIELNEYSLVF